MRFKYEYTEGRNDCAIRVSLDDRVVGSIKPVSADRSQGWQYFPKGSRTGGEVFPSVIACQHSLEWEPDGGGDSGITT